MKHILICTFHLIVECLLFTGIPAVLFAVISVTCMLGCVLIFRVCFYLGY